MKNKHLVELYVEKILNEEITIDDVPRFLLKDVKSELERRKED